jgi:hypothetical protein
VPDSDDDGEAWTQLGGRSANPPRQIYYVAWGRSQFQRSHFYRGPGWARRRAQQLSESGHFVRVLRAEVAWVDATVDFLDASDQESAANRLDWATGNRLRTALLDAPVLANFVRDRPRLDALVDRVEGLAARLRRS